MSIWSVYTLSDGLLTGRVIQSLNRGRVTENTPEGCGVIEGRWSAKTYKVDLETGAAVAWQPPKPDDTEFVAWVWDADRGWQQVATEAAVGRDVRAERDRRLATCDWVTLRATELGEEVPPAWLDYRQALRDITEQPGFPSDVDWPTPPG